MNRKKKNRIQFLFFFLLMQCVLNSKSALVLPWWQIETMRKSQKMQLWLVCGSTKQCIAYLNSFFLKNHTDTTRTTISSQRRELHRIKKYTWTHSHAHVVKYDTSHPINTHKDMQAKECWRVERSSNVNPPVSVQASSVDDAAQHTFWTLLSRTLLLMCIMCNIRFLTKYY